MKCDIRLKKNGTFTCASCKATITEEQWTLGDIPECSGPSLMTKALNVGTAIVGHVANSAHQVPEEIAQQRLSICESNECGYYRENSGNPNCGHCGCFLKIKTVWANEACPIGKWGSFTKKQGCSSC